MTMTRPALAAVGANGAKTIRSVHRLGAVPHVSGRPFFAPSSAEWR